MADAITFRLLRTTPLIDVARGRLTGRLDWRARVDTSALPAPARALIRRVVWRTFLGAADRVAVADELVAHFADGLAGGGAVDEMVRDFGDEWAAARLIRRAKLRNKSPVWHAARGVAVAGLLLGVTYGLLRVRFALGTPSPRVDYVSALNAPALAAPAEDLAWPLYREALLGLYDADRSAGDAPPDDARLADEPLIAFRAWLADHADDLAVARAAAARPTLGLLVGPDGSRFDAELARALPRGPFRAGPDAPPDLSFLHRLSEPDEGLADCLGIVIHSLDGDAHAAIDADDPARFVADVEALLGLARQLRTAPLPGGARGEDDRAYGDALDRIAQVLNDRPGFLAPAHLARLAHALDVPRVAGDWIDLAVERARLLDVVQRIYTDDGRGDGRLTPFGWTMGHFTPNFTPEQLTPSNVWRQEARRRFVPPTMLVESRRAALDEGEAFLEETADLLAGPRRDADWDRLFPSGTPVYHGRPQVGRTVGFRIVVQSFESRQEEVERAFGRRDGTVVALALELYRQRHGHFPATLAPLVPQLLPRVPADRITGSPVGYRLIDGEPVVYSVGVDRDDDGGRATTRGDAAQWRTPDAGPADGDWILFDGRSPPDQATTHGS